MSVIGNPLSLGGGFKVETPTGNIYNGGYFLNNDIIALISDQDGWVSAMSSYVRVDVSKSKYKKGGLVIGPIKFGNGYTATGRGPNQYNIKLQLDAVLESKANYVMRHGNGNYTDENNISQTADLAQTTAGTATIDTTAFKGKIGYLFVVFVTNDYGADRTDARITRVVAT